MVAGLAGDEGRLPRDEGRVERRGRLGARRRGDEYRNGRMYKKHLHVTVPSAFTSGERPSLARPNSRSAETSRPGR